jgi:HlyD family secretion protein
MDIKREGAARARKIRRIIYGSSIVLFIALTSVALSRLKPAAPGVDAGTLYREAVKRGPMKIEVQGLGTLVPEDILWIPAVTDGRVVKRLLPGVPVKADTILVVLKNPQLEQQTLSAEWQMKKAQADYNSLKAQLDSQVLEQRATAATANSDYLQAKLQSEHDQQLAKLGLGPKITAQLSEAKAQVSETRDKIASNQVDVLKESVVAQLAASQASIEQLRAQYDLDKSQLDALSVRAGADGVLQEVPVEVGQQVTAGTILAKVAQPTHLKAQLKVAETQAKDVQLGQVAEIDTRTVDVKLDGALPPGAVPDLSVDGTIEIEDLKDVVYVGRPAFGQPDSKISLFKIVDDGKEAVRVQVVVGKASVNTIQILSGLNVGDEVILSDMSRWDGFDRVRLQ